MSGSTRCDSITFVFCLFDKDYAPLLDASAVPVPRFRRRASRHSFFQIGIAFPGSLDSELFGPGPVLKLGRPDDSNFCGYLVMDATKDLTDRITVDPTVPAGKPIVRGTRIPVDLVLEQLGLGPRSALDGESTNIMNHNASFFGSYVAIPGFPPATALTPPAAIEDRNTPLRVIRHLRRYA